MITKLYYKFMGLIAKILGRNSKYTPVDVIVAQLNEPRPLPVGVGEWKEFADRILSGTLFTAERDSYEYVLANMILTLGPTESHKPDAYFIHSLKKVAANQIADNRRKELYAAKKAKEDLEKSKQAMEANPQAEATLERAKGLQLVKEAPVLENK